MLLSLKNSYKNIFFNLFILYFFHNKYKKYNRKMSMFDEPTLKQMERENNKLLKNYPYNNPANKFTTNIN